MVLCLSGCVRWSYVSRRCGRLRPGLKADAGSCRHSSWTRGRRDPSNGRTKNERRGCRCRRTKGNSASRWCKRCKRAWVLLRRGRTAIGEAGNGERAKRTDESVARAQERTAPNEMHARHRIASVWIRLRLRRRAAAATVFTHRDAVSKGFRWSCSPPLGVAQQKPLLAGERRDNKETSVSGWSMAVLRALVCQSMRQPVHLPRGVVVVGRLSSSVVVVVGGCESQNARPGLSMGGRRAATAAVVVVARTGRSMFWLVTGLFMRRQLTLPAACAAGGAVRWPSFCGATARHHRALQQQLAVPVTEPRGWCLGTLRCRGGASLATLPLRD